MYDIAAHYQHEAMRGVEDVSTMARAMYGPKRFDRFSPTRIVENLPQNAWSVLCVVVVVIISKMYRLENHSNAVALYKGRHWLDSGRKLEMCRKLGILLVLIRR